MTDNDPPRRRAQFSLLNLLFLGTTIAALAGLYGSWRTIRQLTESHRTILVENAKLRAEQGALTIEDSTKVHAIQIADLRDGVWSYRVYLPPGHGYYLAGQANKLPLNHEPPRYGPGAPPDLNTNKSGRSDRGGLITANGCSPGEHLVSVALTRDDQGEKVFRARMTPATPEATGANIGMGIREEPGKWPAVELSEVYFAEMETGIPTRTQTTMAADAGPLVILEKRFMHGDVKNSADSDEGLIVWIGVIHQEKQTTEPELE